MNDHLHPIFRDALNGFANLTIRPAPRQQTYIAEIDTRIAGIPARIGVVEFCNTPGDIRADNPYDYYGGIDTEYDILDTRGRPAPWLERKLSGEDRDELEREIARCMS